MQLIAFSNQSRALASNQRYALDSKDVSVASSSVGNLPDTQDERENVHAVSVKYKKYLAAFSCSLY